MERRDEEKFTEITNSITMNNLKKIIDEKGCSKEKVATSIGIAESTIYKGKLYQGIDREYTTTDVVNVNAANILSYIEDTNLCFFVFK